MTFRDILATASTAWIDLIVLLTGGSKIISEVEVGEQGPNAEPILAY